MSKKCPHGVRKCFCKACGGSSICKHGRQKRLCRECGGAAFCEHGRLKHRCRECGGSSFCEHGRQKYRCRECGGSGICEHGTRKSNCKQCGGSALCQHDREKRYCKECGGTAYCEHGRLKRYCRECGGSGFCPHGRHKNYCKDCGGSSICEHGVTYSNCGICTPYKCEGCGLFRARKNQDGNRLCATCNPYSRTVTLYDERRAESKVNKFLCDNYPSATFPIGTYAPFRSCGDIKRPDTILHFPAASHAFIIETDENCHNEYNNSCEWSKILNHAQSLLQTFDLHNVTVIRFNPDAWKVAGKTVNFSFKDRLELLKSVIERRMASGGGRMFTVFHMFYPVAVAGGGVVESTPETVEARLSEVQVST